MSFRKVGVDLGLCGPHHISVGDEAGNIVRPPLHVGTSAQDFDRLYAHALEGAPAGTQLKIIFEPTALIWLPFAIYTRAKGHLLYRVKTQQPTAVGFTICASSISVIERMIGWMPKPA